MKPELTPLIFSKPTGAELQQAISVFAEGPDRLPFEENFKASYDAMMIIVGEACSLLAQGNLTDGVVASLGERGLSSATAT